MENVEQLIERIKSIQSEKGMTNRSFAINAKIDPSHYNKMLTCEKPISERTVMRICEAYGINRDWLMTGEGRKYIADIQEASPITDAHIVKIPLVGQYAYAGYLSGYADREYIEQLPTIPFMPDRTMTGNYLAFEIHGDSMDDGTRDAYCQGDIVICREVEPYNYQHSALHFKRRDFVLVCVDGILIKRVIAHDVERHVITIHSLNPEFQDREIDLSQVKQIFSIIESRQNRSR